MGGSTGRGLIGRLWEVMQSLLGINTDIKDNTDKFTFDVSGNLCVKDSGDDADLTAIIDELEELNAKVSTEVTLDLVLDELQAIDLNTGDNATETTLAAIKAVTDLLTFTGGDLNVNAAFSGGATEAKQDTQITILTAIDAVLDAIKLDTASTATNTANLDVALSTRATESTLEAARVLLASLDGKDFATETTQSTLLTAIDTVLDAIKLDTANLDVLLSTRASESTLAAIKAKTDLLTFTADKLKTTGEDGGGAGGNFNDKLLQVDSVGSTTYLGYADPGTATSAATWAVKRVIETGPDASITWADGNNSFDNIWNNRLTLTYS